MVERHFSWEASTQKIEEIYSTCLKKETLRPTVG
jgi:hypothetical protein